jgi:hypothetical protein
MLYNVSTAPTMTVSGELLDLFLVSRTDIVSGFYQVSVRWSNHDVLRFFRSVSSGHGALRSSMVSGVSVLLLHCWTGRLFDLWLGYSMLYYLMETFAPMRMVKVRDGDDMSGVRNWEC